MPQSAGHLPLDVQALGCDFSRFQAINFAVRPVSGRCLQAELQAAMPPYQGGGGMISTVGFQTSEYHEPPHNRGWYWNIAGAVGLHAAMDYLDALGSENIHAHDTDIAAYAKERLAEFDGIRIFGPAGERGGLVSLCSRKCMR